MIPGMITVRPEKAIEAYTIDGGKFTHAVVADLSQGFRVVGIFTDEYDAQNIAKQYRNASVRELVESENVE